MRKLATADRMLGEDKDVADVCRFEHVLDAAAPGVLVAFNRSGVYLVERRAGACPRIGRVAVVAATSGQRQRGEHHQGRFAHEAPTLTNALSCVTPLFSVSRVPTVVSTPSASVRLASL